MNRNSSLIEDKAKELIDNLGIKNYPIDVEDIARKLNIRVAVGDMDGSVSGFLRREGEITVIGVNSKHSKKRQRFTIGHELGHFNLHLSGSSSMFIDKSISSAFFARDSDSSLGVYQKEIEANSFAAALLMPEKLVRECLDRYSKRYSSIEDIAWKMAKDFDVSEQAMTLRLVRLGIFEVE